MEFTGLDGRSVGQGRSAAHDARRAEEARWLYGERGLYKAKATRLGNLGSIESAGGGGRRVYVDDVKLVKV